MVHGANVTESTDILFCLPPQHYEGFSHSLLGYYLAAHLQKDGVRCRQFVDYSPIGPLDAVVAKIGRIKSAIYAFVAYDTNVLLALAIARRVKKNYPEARIVFGGPFCQPVENHKLLMEEGSPVDVAVSSSGYVALPLLIKAWRGSGDLESIPGIIFKGINGIVRTPRPNRVPLLEQESPYLEGILPLPEYYRDERSFALVTAQGCDAHCLFCNYAVINNFTVDFAPLDRTMEELRILDAFARRRGVRPDVFLSEDDFAIDIERAKEFCLRVIRGGMNKSLALTTHLSVHRADEELLTLMAKAGFQQANFGIESGVPQILHRMKKLHHIGRCDDLSVEAAYLEKAKRLITHARKVNLNATASFVSGMPFEQYEDALQTVDFVKSLNIARYSFNLFIPWSGSIYARQNGQALTFDDRYKLLPKRTRFPFDPTMVPRLPNAFAYPDVGLARYFSGDYSGSVKKLGLLHPKLVFVGADADAATRKDLGGILNIGDHVVHEVRDDVAMTQFEDECVANELPVSIVRYIHPLKNAEGIRELHAHPEYEVTSLLGNGFSQAQKMDLSFDGRPRRAEDTAILVSADDNENVDAFLRKVVAFVRNSRKPPKLSEIIPTTGYSWLLDSCRWAASPCPALTMGRVIVGKDRSYSPCFNGPQVTLLSPDPKGIRTAFKRAMEAKRKNLDCENCVARNNCSRCVATGALPQEAYCAVIKSCDWVPHIIPMLRILRGVMSSAQLDNVRIGFRPRQVFELTIPSKHEMPCGYNDRGTYLIKTQREYFMVETRTGKIFDLDATEVCAFEALRCGIRKSKTMDLLSNNYGLSRGRTKAILNEISSYALPEGGMAIR